MYAPLTLVSALVQNRSLHSFKKVEKGTVKMEKHHNQDKYGTIKLQNKVNQLD